MNETLGVPATQSREERGRGLYSCAKAARVARCPIGRGTVRQLLHPVGHVTTSRRFLARAVECSPTLSFTTFAGPKYRAPKMASHDLRAGSAKHRCLRSIVTW